MARTVVITFKDNEAAEAFCRLQLESTDPTKEGWGDKAQQAGIIASSMGKIEAIVAKPTSYCKCLIMPKKYYGKRGRNAWSEETLTWQATPRFGWRIHVKCKKPSRLFVTNFITYMLTSAGNNLLPEIEAQLAPPPSEEPQGLEVPAIVQASGGDDTQAIQEAVDKGAATSTITDSKWNDWAEQVRRDREERLKKLDEEEQNGRQVQEQDHRQSDSAGPTEGQEEHDTRVAFARLEGSTEKFIGGTETSGLRPEVQRSEPDEVRRVRSSDGSKIYVLERRGDEWTHAIGSPECPGYLYRNTCRHITEAAATPSPT